MRGADAKAWFRQQVLQDVAAVLPDLVDPGVNGRVCCLDEGILGGVQGDAETGPVRVEAVHGVGGIGHRGAQQSVGDQECPGLLFKAIHGACAQDTSAEHRGFQFLERGLDFPPLKITTDHLGCRALSVVGERGGQPVVADLLSSLGLDSEFGIDDAHLGGAEMGALGSVGVGFQDRELASVLEAQQEPGPGPVDAGQQVLGGEIPVPPGWSEPHRWPSAPLEPAGRPWLAAFSPCPTRTESALVGPIRRRSGRSGHAAAGWPHSWWLRWAGGVGNEAGFPCVGDLNRKRRHVPDLVSDHGNQRCPASPNDL